MLKAGDASKIGTKRAATRKKRKFNGRQTGVILFYMDFCLMDGKYEMKKKF